MWFSRKSKNRRLGSRDYVLDVKLRSSQVRAARARVILLGFTSLGATVLALYLAWCAGDWLLDRLVYDNKAFALQELDIQTDGAVSVEQLRRWSGVNLDQNLLALDLGEVRRNLQFISIIQSASVERLLPRTLRIRVIEREPMAQVKALRPAANGTMAFTTYQLDAAGYVIVPLTPNQRGTPSDASTEPLPELQGVNATDLEPGHRINTPQVQAALHLLAAFERSPMEGLAELKTIDVSSPEVLVATTSQNCEITFGLTDIDQQLRRWRVIFDSGQTIGKALASLDLAITNHIPARWLEASAAPLPPVKHLKPAKKKHV